jgi:hypothetical protein
MSRRWAVLAGIAAALLVALIVVSLLQNAREGLAVARGREGFAGARCGGRGREGFAGQAAQAAVTPTAFARPTRAAFDDDDAPGVDTLRDDVRRIRDLLDDVSASLNSLERGLRHL